VEHDDLVAALSQLSESEASQVINQARAHDSQQRKEQAAEMLRSWLHPTLRLEEPETPPRKINRRDPMPWAKTEPESNDSPESEDENA
jgi:hypothetical protein